MLPPALAPAGLSWGDIPLPQLGICVAVSFIAGAIDAMAGGGGILTMPAIATFGLPNVAWIAGTNKFVGTSGSITASVRFILKRKMDRTVALWGGLLAAGGGCLGALTLDHFAGQKPKEMFTVFGILLIVIALYLAFQKDLGRTNTHEGPTRRTVGIAALTGLGIGFYDGFFGPGTGSFLVFIMIRYLKFDFVVGTGNAKFLNFASNIASLSTFIAKGLVVWPIAIPMGVANAAGSWLGASLAIAKGARFVRGVFLAVAVAIAGWMICKAVASR